MPSLEPWIPFKMSSLFCKVRKQETFCSRKLKLYLQGMHYFKFFCSRRFLELLYNRQAKSSAKKEMTIKKIQNAFLFLSFFFSWFPTLNIILRGGRGGGGERRGEGNITKSPTSLNIIPPPLPLPPSLPHSILWIISSLSIEYLPIRTTSHSWMMSSKAISLYTLFLFYKEHMSYMYDEEILFSNNAQIAFTFTL